MSITKFWGNTLNEIGNVTLAGHNSLTGAMFGRLSRLTQGDIIEIIDEYGVMIEYEIFDIYVIYPDDIGVILPVEENVREITLITCINGRVNRLIIKARQII